MSTAVLRFVFLQSLVQVSDMTYTRHIIGLHTGLERHEE